MKEKEHGKYNEIHIAKKEEEEEENIMKELRLCGQCERVPYKIRPDEDGDGDGKCKWRVIRMCANSPE